MQRYYPRYCCSAHCAGRRWHRFEAAKKLGWTSIRAIIVEDRSADLMDVMEIDEHLVRADLSPAERAAHQAERKRL
jgi:ParB-like chromosome segregation protein Spo0J